MARIRAKNSKTSLDGLGLKPEEDQLLSKLIEKHDISIAQLKRALIRQWIAEGGEGVLRYSTK